MSRRVWRSILAAALLVLVACGGDKPPADRLTTAAERTASAGSARVAVEQRLSGVGPQQVDVTISGEGVVSLAERRGHVTMVLAGGASDGGEYEVIFDGTVAYLRLPQLPAPTAAIPGGAAQPGAPDDVTFTIDYFDFGAPVEVTPPPPEETTDAQDLFAPQA